MSTPQRLVCPECGASLIQNVSGTQEVWAYTNEDGDIQVEAQSTMIREVGDFECRRGSCNWRGPEDELVPEETNQ